MKRFKTSENMLFFLRYLLRNCQFFDRHNSFIINVKEGKQNNFL